MNYEKFSHSIGVVATGAGVSVETIRFYQRKGLLPKPTRQHGQIDPLFLAVRAAPAPA